MVRPAGVAVFLAERERPGQRWPIPMLTLWSHRTRAAEPTEARPSSVKPRLFAGVSPFYACVIR